MSSRDDQKRNTRKRIVEATAKRLREEGFAGAAVTDVMRDAGLTHGGFYLHFRDKTALAEEALGHAVSERRDEWFRGLDNVGGPDLASALAGRYLNAWHREHPGLGCAFAAVGAEVPRAAGPVRDRYEAELTCSISAVAAGLRRGGELEDEQAADAALAFLAMCIGGLQMARAVRDEELSDRILRVCRQAAADLAASDRENRENRDDQ